MFLGISVNKQAGGTIAAYELLTEMDLLPRTQPSHEASWNSAAGYPGYQKENGLSKSSFITRMSISPTSFELMTVYSSDEEYEMSRVAIPSLIET